MYTHSKLRCWGLPWYVSVGGAQRSLPCWFLFVVCTGTSRDEATAGSHIPKACQHVRADASCGTISTRLPAAVLGAAAGPGCVRPLFKHMFIPSVGPSLALCGLPRRCAKHPQFQLQGQLLARLLSGRAALPPQHEMEQVCHSHTQ
jgi:hypothetical protein